MALTINYAQGYSGGFLSVPANTTVPDSGAGQLVQFQISETVTLATGAATTDTTSGMLPAGTVIVGVGYEITTAITGTTLSSIGDPTTATRFASGLALSAAGASGVGFAQWFGNVATVAAGPSQAAAASVRITCAGNPSAGAVKITSYCWGVLPRQGSL